MPTNDRPGQPDQGPWRDPAAFPPYRVDDLRSSHTRAPAHDAIRVPSTVSERTGPGPAVSGLWTAETDLTRDPVTGGEAIGERIIVTGRVLDAAGEPVRGTVIEIWQSNAAGRYRDEADQHDAPLDPNFTGRGRCITGDDGTYRFLTIKPAAYPWKNHPNAWRPAHIHFSVFGDELAARLVTQMYFPGDPLLELDPIVMAVPAEGRPRIVAQYDHSVTEEAWALGYRFDIVLRGPSATPADPVL